MSTWKEYIEELNSGDTDFLENFGGDVGLFVDLIIQKGLLKHLRVNQSMDAEVENKIISAEAINLIESCLPIESFSKDQESIESEQVQSITDPEAFNFLIDAYFLACVSQVDEHPTLKEVLDFTINVEPFSSQWKYTESYIRNNLKAKWKLK
jgi:hypothetical protein